MLSLRKGDTKGSFHFYVFFLPDKTNRIDIRIMSSHNMSSTKVRRKKTFLFGENSHCHYCGIELSYKTATLDHVVPASKGGTNRIENLVLSCKYCNMFKMDKVIPNSPNAIYYIYPPMDRLRRRISMIFDKHVSLAMPLKRTETPPEAFVSLKGSAMGYKVTKLQNQHPPTIPTISISEGEEGWEEAYSNWKQGNPPTDNKEWTKKGTMITALTTLIPENPT